MRAKDKKPYRIVGAYDSETTNIYGTHASAFPILHQLGLIGIPIEEITAENVERETALAMYRHTFEICAAFDELAGRDLDYIPVICCHNLSFDMWPLAEWLNSHDVRVLAKSRQKPITFTIRDEFGNPRLVIWDTLVFSGQSLEGMGDDCGYPKAVGYWDYNLIRTPETPLTADETEYAAHDIYALLAWLGWWLRRNPDIAPSKLGLNVVTKTGVVRERRRVRFDSMKGQGCKYDIGRFWLYQNRTEAPRSDDELFVMHACTRGGLTFCSSENASVPFDLEGSSLKVAGYDAASMHPAQMVSHRYPMRFHETSCKALASMYDVVAETTLDEVLSDWAEPFGVAFNACFRFVNIRPKKGSIFERWGVLPLASARFSTAPLALDEDNEQGQLFKRSIMERGYMDRAVNPVFAFGKLVSADACELYITELAAWEISQCYDYDSVEPVSGYGTMRFARPTDMSTASVCSFYRAKNTFKHAMEEYSQTGTITCDESLKAVGIPENIILNMRHGNADDGDVKQTYQRTKADLNSLFGIEASNEYRMDTVLGASGIEYRGEQGIANAPKNPKTWYQFGQRIVGWSRIAQIVVMELASPYVETCINGDTDSVKFLVDESKLDALDRALERHAEALDKGKRNAMARFRRAYPSEHDPLDGIGHYEREFLSDRYCAAWNKAYAMQDIDPRDGKRHFSFTIAGIPARRGLNRYADKMGENGYSFGEITDRVLGYNQTVCHDLTGLNARSFPEWGDTFFDEVEDYLGNRSTVAEPCALALYPMDKELNSTRNADNRANLAHAIKNRPSVCIDSALMYWRGDDEPGYIETALL